MNDEMAGNLVGGHYYYSAAVTPVAHVLFVELYVQSRRHVQLYAYFATAVEAAKAFDGAVRRTIEVHKNLSYSGPLSDKQGYMFRAMLQINFPTTEEKAFMRNYEQNWRRKPFELRLEDSDGGVVEWKYETQCIHGIKDYDDGGFRCSINENKSQPEPSLRQRKRPDRVIQPSKSPAP